MTDKTHQKCLAEFVGTFVMVFVGTGAIIANDFVHGRVGIVGIGLAFGLSVFSMIYLLAPISGAHLNPAVTVSLYFARKISINLIFPFIGCQCAGAMSASLLLFLLFPHHPTLGATIPTGSVAQSFFLEIFLSFVLLFAILTASYRRLGTRIGPALIIGAIIALEAIFAGPISGASMNPARSLAPAIVSGHLEHLWIYLIAPIIGGILAVPINKAIRDGRALPLPHA